MNELHTVMKTCSKCSVEKSIDAFHKDPRQRFGVRPDCKECKRNQNKKGYIENKAARMEYKKRQIRKSRQDPVFRFKESISEHVRQALKKEGGYKNISTWAALPYTATQLREHLETQFDNQMTWDNYGTYWHIDHIYPQSRLPYDSCDHPNFQKCWALENLRPLEAIANIQKSNKVLTST